MCRMGATRIHSTANPAAGALTPEELTQAFLHCRYQLQVIIYRTTGSWDEAQALTQEVFLRAFRARHGFTRQASVTTWLTRIAINIGLESRRRMRPNLYSAEQPGIADEVGSVPFDGPSPEDFLLEHAQSEFVQDLLATLSPQLRQAVIYRYLRGMSLAEIVDRTGVKATTMKARLNRALRHLRKHIRRSSFPIVAANLPNLVAEA